MKTTKSNKLKRKWEIIIMLIILFAVIPFSKKEVYAWTEETIGFWTELDENATDGNGNPLINVYNYNGSEENLVIPEKIDGSQVFQIFDWNWYGVDYSSIKSIDIKGNFVYLGNANAEDFSSQNVFFNCSNLEKNYNQ